MERLYLAPLKISAAEAAFTDIYPAFVVKYASGKRRRQGTAIEQECDAIARDLNMPTSSGDPEATHGVQPSSTRS